tara:strand:+ start:2924 stop:3346 length:423 start_codon:yes stop_codon:yes gene_type:complete
MDRPICGWCGKPAALVTELHIVCNYNEEPTADTPRCKADLEKLTNQRIAKIYYRYSDEWRKIDWGDQRDLVDEAIKAEGKPFQRHVMANKLEREMASDKWVMSYTTHDGESYHQAKGNFCGGPCAVKFANASYRGGYRRG